MGNKKSEKNVRNVPVTVRLNEEKSRHLKNCAAACGLSVAEFMRQLCRGIRPIGANLSKTYTKHKVLDAFYMIKIKKRFARGS